jgi:hypothetical protein
MENVIVKLGKIFRFKKMKFIEPEIEFTNSILFLDENFMHYSSTDLRLLLSINKKLKLIWCEMKERIDENNKEIKWKYAAIVIDRLFFYLSLIYSTVTFILIILTIPNLYKLI